MSIPTEPIGSLPRPRALQEALVEHSEGRLSLKLDPSGGVLDDFIALNNEVLGRFSEAERARLGVHTCPGADRDSTHSLDVAYAGLLPKLFQLKVGNFCLQLASEPDPERVLQLVAGQPRPCIRVFVGVTDPIDTAIETPGRCATGSCSRPATSPSTNSAPATTPVSPRTPTTPPPRVTSPPPRSTPACEAPRSPPRTSACGQPCSRAFHLASLAR